MPRRETQLAVGEHYHVYNRGNNRQPVCFERDNYLFLLRQWRKYVTPACQVIAYCLMPTHYHFLVHIITDGFSHGMQLLGISYTKAINKQRNRVGALFQGAFRAQYIERDEYLLHVSRYIHLNPVLIGLVQRPEDWEFSSYRDYLGLRRGSLPVSDVVLGQFATADAYRAFVESYAPADRQDIAGLAFDNDE